VSGVKGISGLYADAHEPLDIDWLRTDEVFESDAVEEFHGDEGAAVLLTDVVNRANVGMIQSGCGLRLALETGECLRVSGDLLRQELQRNEAMQPRVLGL
jgi:hypothetical protein